MNYAKRTVLASMFGLGLEGMDIMILSFALPLLLKEFGVGQTLGGLISSVTTWGMLVGGILFGILADRFGRVRVFTYSILLFAIGTAVTGFAHSVTEVYVWRFVAGLGAGGEYGIGMALVTEAWPKEWRGRASSYVSIGGQLGTIVAALLSAAILPSLGWRPLFFVGIVPVLLAAYLRMRLEESPVWLEWNRRTQGAGSVPLRKLFDTPGRAFSTVALTVMASVQVAGYYGLMTWLPSILQKSHHFTVGSSSLWMVATIVGMILGMLVFGQLMDRIGRKWSYGIFLVAAAAAIFLYSLVRSPMALLIGGALVGFFANGMYAGYGALISEHYPTASRSTAENTIFNLGRGIGGFAPTVIGYMLQTYSLESAMATVSVLYLISLVMVVLLKDKSRWDLAEEST